MSGKCPRCTKTCYESEGVKVLGKYYHPACFNCFQCKKGLQLTDYTPDKSTGEIYCPSCHNSLFGPKGFRGGGTSATIGVVTHSAVDGAAAAKPTSSSGAASPPKASSPKPTAAAGGGGGGGFCSECGTKKDAGNAKFCANCGHKF